jgi:hypothetical protein
MPNKKARKVIYLTEFSVQKNDVQQKNEDNATKYRPTPLTYDKK